MIRSHHTHGRKVLGGSGVPDMDVSKISGAKFVELSVPFKHASKILRTVTLTKGSTMDILDILIYLFRAHGHPDGERGGEGPFFDHALRTRYSRIQLSPHTIRIVTLSAQPLRTSSLHTPVFFGYCSSESHSIQRSRCRTNAVLVCEFRLCAL